MIQTNFLFWIRERFHDGVRWPLNLIRDFPKRSKRLFHTFQSGWSGLFHLPADIRRAHHNQQIRLLGKQKARRFMHGLHLLLVGFFDLVGGPEIAQFFMHLITFTTPLTEEEISIISDILEPNGMRYENIRIAEGGLLERVFQINGRLAFTTWYTINLPQATSKETQTHTRQNQALLVHELIHVFQYEKVGSCYMTEAIHVLVKTKRDCYQYGGASGLEKAQQTEKQFNQFNREQQAQIIQDYFTRRQKQFDTTAYKPYVEQLRRGLL